MFLYEDRAQCLMAIIMGMKQRCFIPTDNMDNRLIRNLRLTKGSQLVARNSEARSLLLDQAQDVVVADVVALDGP